MSSSFCALLVKEQYIKIGQHPHNSHNTMNTIRHQLCNPTYLKQVKYKDLNHLIHRLDDNNRKMLSGHLVKNYHLQDWICDPKLAVDELSLRILCDVVQDRMKLQQAYTGKWLNKGIRDYNHHMRIILLIICIKSCPKAYQDVIAIDWLLFRRGSFKSAISK